MDDFSDERLHDEKPEKLTSKKNVTIKNVIICINKVVQFVSTQNVTITILHSVTKLDINRHAIGICVVSFYVKEILKNQLAKLFWKGRLRRYRKMGAEN